MFDLPDDTNDSIVPQPCRHADCTITTTIACYVPGGDQDSEPDAWYCRTHAPIHGFCASCGEHHGGEEDFENSYDGVCDLCASEREHMAHMHTDLYDREY